LKIVQWFILGAILFGLSILAFREKNAGQFKSAAKVYAFSLTAKTLRRKDLKINYKNFRVLAPLRFIFNLDFLVNHKKRRENKNFLPRAYLAQSFVVLNDEVAISDKLKSKDFDPRKEVILEEKPPVINAKPVNARKTEKESVRIVSYQPNEVAIDVNISKQPKFLVLADNYYPGWEVFVDNKKEKLYKANFTLRAVYLSCGEHKVKFVYNPISFKIGLLISFSFAILIILALVLYNLKGKLKPAA
jgi:hypothetical protein